MSGVRPNRHRNESTVNRQLARTTTQAKPTSCLIMKSQKDNKVLTPPAGIFNFLKTQGNKGIRVFLGSAPGVKLGLRERYVFTRDNRLRLRYTAAAVTLGMLLTGVAMRGPGTGAMTYQQAMDDHVVTEQEIALASIEPASGISSLLDGRLYGKFSLNQIELPDVESPSTRVLEIKKGDVLGSVLQKAGIASDEVVGAIAAMKEHFNPKSLKPGQSIEVNFDPTDEGSYEFSRMKIQVDPLKSVTVERKDDIFIAQLEEKPVERRGHAAQVDISLSLYGSAEQAGIPRNVIADVIRIYSWDVDFQRDIRRGDRIEVMYDSYETEDGYVAKTGDIQYAKLIVGGVEKPLYRYEMDDGRVDYFSPDGRSARKALMKTPIDGARISSGFGMRRHPVLGYSKMHKGMDFAAPTGTPIYAAGDGVVEKAGRFSSYGNYLRIRHNTSIKTAYAHLSRFSKGISAGTRVKQGQVVAYVGTTGRSTGPHLHYEVMLDGNQVNPNSLKLPTGETLGGRELAKFKGSLREIDQVYAAALANGTKLASNGQGRAGKFN